MKVQKGFTLIEMMVVVAIIGILAAISLQGYTQYMTRAANRACLAEGKAFTTQLNLFQANSAALPDKNSVGACVSPVAGTIDATTTSVAFTPKAPGSGTITCAVATLVCTGP
ncbi:pilin [Roseateles sp.]|uniref:pilin n=1 Tax=Roseateles sp. TaxID=1971397 RepID=UPI003BA7489D